MLAERTGTPSDSIGSRWASGSQHGCTGRLNETHLTAVHACCHCSPTSVVRTLTEPRSRDAHTAVHRRVASWAVVRTQDLCTALYSDFGLVILSRISGDRYLATNTAGQSTTGHAYIPSRTYILHRIKYKCTSSTSAPPCPDERATRMPWRLTQGQYRCHITTATTRRATLTSTSSMRSSGCSSSLNMIMYVGLPRPLRTRRPTARTI